MKTVTCLGQPSWKFASDRVEAFITRAGGQLAPVKFRLGNKTISPFSVAPWAEEKLPATLPPLLQALRGDFFCAPFGGNEKPYRGEAHPPHGETANADWNFESLKGEGGITALHLSLKIRARRGRIDKFVFLRKGETAIYSRHVISGLAGRMSMGHHAMLKFPDEECSGILTTSPIRFAQVVPPGFELPVKRGYTSLKDGATFQRLDRVPRADGRMADISRYPARRGFEDLAMIAHQARPDFAWAAVTFPKERYVWFALKDPRVLQSTVLWMSNGGRHYAPWNGRHVNVLGVEDVTAYFHLGIEPSASANGVNRRGVATSLVLRKEAPLIVNYIMAVAAIPAGFASVRQIVPDKKGVTLISPAKKRVSVPLHLPFLYESAS